MIDWDKAKEIATLLEVVKEDSRRESLMMLLRAEGYRLPRAVPSSQLHDLNKLAEFIRINSKKVSP
jgi:hypothetical protein